MSQHAWRSPGASRRLPTSLRRAQDAIIACEACPRLRQYCAAVAREKRRAYREYAYWGKPVSGFGDPAAHGANRTGRMFTGDGMRDRGDRHVGIFAPRDESSKALAQTDLGLPAEVLNRFRQPVDRVWMCAETFAGWR